MDATRFDRVSRLLVTASTRRAAISGLISGAIAVLVAWPTGEDTVEAAACPKRKKRCKQRCIPRRQCCTTGQCRPAATGKVCRRRRCVCRPGTKPCQGRCIHPAAACPPQPDAACQVPGNASALFPPGFRIAQTFTEPNGGRLTAIELVIDSPSASTGTYKLEINTVDAMGVPENNTIATVLRPADQIGNVAGPVVFTLPVPPTLLPGRQYAMVLSFPGATDFFGVRTIQPSPCPGGQLFESLSATAPFQALGPPSSPFGTIYRTFVSP